MSTKSVFVSGGVCLDSGRSAALRSRAGEPRSSSSRGNPRGLTQGFIARDPARLEIVVVLRGTFRLKDAVTCAWFTFQFQFFPFTFSPPSPPRSSPESVNRPLSHELNELTTDAKFLLVPFESPGIVELVHVHRGFLGAY
jgi:hypothetical protein